VFEAVETGDVVGYAQRVLDKVNHLDGLSEFPVHAETIDRLASTYSSDQERFDMKLLINRMGLNSA
jgi:hypothetical protein